MSTTNPVYQVLVTKGNQAPLAAGNPVSALAPNQIGVFNVHTGQSVGVASTVQELSNIFLAVGVNRSGAGGGLTLEDINGSAGQLIQSNLVNGYDNRCYVAPTPKIVDITNFKTKCETEYVIKIEFRNQNIYSQYGYNQFDKTWVELSSCCDSGTCVDCDTNGDCNALALAFVTDINIDPDKLVLANLLDYTTTPGTPVVVPDSGYAAWVADPANAGKCLGIRLTSIPTAIQQYCDVNLKYYNPRGTNILVFALDGFYCNGEVDTFQELTYEEGHGYDIRALEYFAGGWNGRPNGSPYRVSTLNGVALAGYEYFADQTVKYSLLSLTNDLQSQSNFLFYKNNLQTNVAIPCGDATTRNGLIAILDKAFPQFAPNAGNSALCDCVGAQTTDEYAVANNGIKILA